MGQAVQLAPAGNEVHYERRRPEEGTLYQVVQEHLETFLADVETETGARLPDFVKDEFDAFLECGILAHGLVRLRCPACAHGKLVAFSCKRRGFCPSCGARLKRNRAGQVVPQLKSPWCDGTTHIVMSPLEFMQRLAALVPRPRLHLIRFHGVLAPHAKLRAQIVPSAPLNAHEACDHHAQGEKAVCFSYAPARTWRHNIRGFWYAFLQSPVRYG